MGNLLLKVFITEYIIVALVFAWEGSWAKVTYFIGATILSLGVLWMR